MTDIINLLQPVHFLHPDMLFWGAGAIVAIASLFLAGSRMRAKARLQYGEERLAGRFNEPVTKLGEIAVLVSWLAATALIFLAMAAPVAPDAPVRVPDGLLQVVVVADVSRSMAAEDYRAQMPPKNGVPAEQVTGPYGTRLDMTKLVIEKEIMPAVAGNEVGIATYMGNGWNVADLTTDYSYLRQSMKHLMKIGNAPGGGSDYGEGLSMALQLFENTPGANKSKAIVLFTDGGFTGTQESLDQTIDKIKQSGIRVIIIGLGSDSPQPIPTYDERTGQQIGNVQKDGQSVSTQIDEAALKSLESESGGEYIRLVPGNRLGIQWAIKFAGSHAEPHENDMFQYPLAVAMVLILALFLRGASRQAPFRTTLFHRALSHNRTSSN